MNRDAIDKYQQQYDVLPFEDKMAAIRKKMLQHFLEKYQPHSLIEVGCGNESIVDYYTNYHHATVIEPARVFYERLQARHSNVKPSHLTIINDFFSESILQSGDLQARDVDVIIISGMLHEIPDPHSILKTAYKLCNTRTVVHVNVPNANSLHRLLALSAGMINSLKEKSALQTLLGQVHTFDMDDLKSMADKNGFDVLEEGSYFIKPFTHAQMEVLRKHEAFGERIIDGLEKLSAYLPDYGAEIFVNLRKKNVAQ